MAPLTDFIDPIGGPYEFPFPKQHCGRCKGELTDYLCAYYTSLGLVCDDCDRTIRRILGGLL